MDGDKDSATDMNPKGAKGVGESTTRRGEDVGQRGRSGVRRPGNKGCQPAGR